jgi:hypothetical protein
MNLIKFDSIIDNFFQSTYKISKKAILLIFFLLVPVMANASGGKVPSVGPVRIEFIIFGLILLGVALIHKQTFRVAVTGGKTGEMWSVYPAFVIRQDN